MTSSSLAVMQPYIFPFIGYFQLIHATDRFVAYDDVQFIKQGWINRNRISNKGSDVLFTVPMQRTSHQARILDVIAAPDDKWQRKFATQLYQEYRKAPHYEPIYDLVMGTFEEARGIPMSRLAVRSITAVMKYLDLPFNCVFSSESFPDTAVLPRAERLITICQSTGSKLYVNLPGGMALYGTRQFADTGIDLRFIFNRSETYPQFAHPFLPHLSIIDVLMHADPERVRTLIGQYELLTAEGAAERPVPASEAGTT